MAQRMGRSGGTPVRPSSPATVRRTVHETTLTKAHNIHDNKRSRMRRGSIAHARGRDGSQSAKEDRMLHGCAPRSLALRLALFGLVMGALASASAVEPKVFKE